jgi:hypothetical protein
MVKRHMSPSWVMLGVQESPNHVILFASNTLVSAELEAASRPDLPVGPRRTFRVRHEGLHR